MMTAMRCIPIRFEIDFRAKRIDGWFVYLKQWRRIFSSNANCVAEYWVKSHRRISVESKLAGKSNVEFVHSKPFKFLSFFCRHANKRCSGGYSTNKFRRQINKKTATAKMRRKWNAGPQNEMHNKRDVIRSNFWCRRGMAREWGALSRSQTHMLNWMRIVQSSKPHIKREFKRANKFIHKFRQ